MDNQSYSSIFWQILPDSFFSCHFLIAVLRKNEDCLKVCDDYDLACDPEFFKGTGHQELALKIGKQPPYILYNTLDEASLTLFNLDYAPVLIK